MVSGHFPNDFSPTITASDLRDSTSLCRFDKKIPGVPSRCGALLTASNSVRVNLRAQEKALTSIWEIRVYCGRSGRNCHSSGPCAGPSGYVAAEPAGQPAARPKVKAVIQIWMWGAVAAKITAFLVG
jgi:hypothetical protein